MTQERTLSNAVGVLVSASETRLMQWSATARGERPDSVIDELWEASPAEAQRMADMIQQAIDVVVREKLNQPEVKEKTWVK